MAIGYLDDSYLEDIADATPSGFKETFFEELSEKEELEKKQETKKNCSQKQCQNEEKIRIIGSNAF